MLERNLQYDRVREILRMILGLLAIALGVMTLLAGGKVLFGDELVRAEAGNIVPFVLKFNFGAAAFYIIAGLAVLFNQRIGLVIARLLAATTVLVFIGLGVHILIGRPFEMRTVMAMTVRSVFWIAQVVILSRLMASVPKASALV